MGDGQNKNMDWTVFCQYVSVKIKKNKNLYPYRKKKKLLAIQFNSNSAEGHLKWGLDHTLSQEKGYCS